MKLGLCALSLLAVVDACDADHSCTLMECAPPLTIVLAGAGGEPLPPSTYEIALVLDGKPTSLACPPDPVAGGWLCEEPEGATDFDVIAVGDTMTGDSISIELQRHENGDVVGPTTVDIDVVARDAQLVDMTLTPEYETSEPNGEGCGRCDEARTETIAIDVPM